MHRLSDYTYDLPQELIAQTPVADRSRSRLLVLDRAKGTLCHKVFYQLPSFLRRGDALVLNDTRVIPARIEARRSTGGFVEIFLLEHLSPEGGWRALARPSSRLKEGENLTLHRGGSACLEKHLGAGEWFVRFAGFSDPGDLSGLGRMPLPRYILREREDDPRDSLDRERYQTVYSRHPGAVAAPTAGLHFTEGLLAQLEAMGVIPVRLTLHVGVGTFAPLREEDITRHRMHSERFAISPKSADTLNRIRSTGGRVAAVGTTSARVLETVIRDDGTFAAASGSTDLYIYPPYRFKAVDLLITNFHLPRSSLLLLVSAFAGRERILDAYREATARGYRFYSYGDAMLLGDHLGDRLTGGGDPGECR